MTPDELDASLRQLLSGVMQDANTIRYIKDDLLDCLEETRAEDLARGTSPSDPFLTLMSWPTATGQATFLLVVFRRDSVTLHAGTGPTEQMDKIVIQSERSHASEAESEVLGLSTSFTSITLERLAIQQWLAR